MDNKETMTLDMAASRYCVKLSTLRIMCLRGTVKSTKVGKWRYVTPAAMNAVFKGEVAQDAKSKRSVK